ncbi:MAG: hypothetical protein ACI8W0_001748 [Flavobacterium sp.]|jgi:hypothetical protein
MRYSFHWIKYEQKPINVNGGRNQSAGKQNR